MTKAGAILSGTVACTLVALMPPAPATAERSKDQTEDRSEDRPTHHGSIGGGGFLALTGPANYGLNVVADFYPRSWERFGLRAEWLDFTATEGGRAALGVSYVAAASRPRLQLALHGELGVAYPDYLPTIGAGIQVILGLFGPVALGQDFSATFLVDGIDSQLALTWCGTLRLAF